MKESFYGGGLHFECTQCHACCRHDPGFVFLGRKDLEKLCQALSLSQEDFLARYTRWVDTGNGRVLSLKEKKNYDCIFWENGCTVYRDRPVQCRTYPFWKGPLSSHQNWQWEGRFCPGIDRGPLHTNEVIQAALAEREDSPPLTPEDL